MKKNIGALDIGGTSIKAGLWDGKKIFQEMEWDTNAGLGGSYVMERAMEILHQLGDFEAIGISTAGQVNPEKGCISYANENIPDYTGMEIRRILEDKFHVPVAVSNDVNAAAVGEAQFGAGRGRKDFLCITYGTGVGGAIVTDGRVYMGSSFSAGEFGGILIHPEDRRSGSYFSGCYEKYASVTALVARARRLDENLDTGRKIFSRIGEDPVREVVDQWIDEIVYGLITLIHVFNPSCIVMGGGVMSQPYILEQVRRKTRTEVMESFRNLEICQAQLGNQAGLLGAAYLASKLVV